jgi:hypothetical protein
MPRTYSALLLASVMALSAALAGLAPTVAHAEDDDGACTAKTFNFKKVEAACKSGGRAAVKDLMKAATKKAKEAGTKIKCKDCHESLKTYDLKDNAVKDLKPWI